jgi:hypothetical protein
MTSLHPGGFPFEVPRTRGRTRFLPDTCPTGFALTARGVALLAKCGRLPETPERDVLYFRTIAKLVTWQGIGDDPSFVDDTLNARKSVVGLPATL